MRDTITVKDALDAGYCVKGQREWFKARGLSFRDFARDGISVEYIRSLNDAMGNDIIRRMEAEHGQES